MPAFPKSKLGFKQFEKKDDLHSFCIFESADSENVVRYMSKKSHSRGRFNQQHGKRAQILFKSSSKHVYGIHWSLARKLCSKNSLLLTCQIFGLPVNTLAADEKCLALHRDNLTILIQIELSEKQKTFSQFFAPFLKSIWNFKNFGSKDGRQRFFISEITDFENVVR